MYTVKVCEHSAAIPFRFQTCAVIFQKSIGFPSNASIVRAFIFELDQYVSIHLILMCCKYANSLRLLNLNPLD